MDFLSKKKKKINIYLPNNLLENEDTDLLKTIKIGILYRIFTMFKIDNIFFYNNEAKKNDLILLNETSHYLERAPYLRKYLPRSDFLKFVGVLPPIQSPSHLGIKSRNIEYREGIILDITKNKERLEILVDMGDEKPIRVNLQNSTKSLKKKEIFPFRCEKKIYKIENPECIGYFWKSNLVFSDKTLKNLIDVLDKRRNIIIGASKEGNNISKENFIELKRDKLLEYDYNILFGPLKGSFKEFFKKNDINLDDVNQWYNFIPNQGTKTVKLEEAIISTLSILNIMI